LAAHAWIVEPDDPAIATLTLVQTIAVRTADMTTGFESRIGTPRCGQRWRRPSLPSLSLSFSREIRFRD
jgi:hypothetical protein